MESLSQNLKGALLPNWVEEAVFAILGLGFRIQGLRFTVLSLGFAAQQRIPKLRTQCPQLNETITPFTVRVC